MKILKLRLNLQKITKWIYETNDFKKTMVYAYSKMQDRMKFVDSELEKYAFTIYSNDYGIETMDLYGMPVTYVCPELERRITEALMMDDRIEDVTDFEFDTSNKRNVHVSFTVVTIFGDFQAEREVNITNE